MAANNFITKLIEECDKCQSITDRNTVKTIRFEDEPHASHQTLGPLFKDDVPEAITTMLKKQCLKPLFQGYDWPKWESARPQVVWPSTTSTWAAWVNRMEPLFGNDWRTLSIFYAIKLFAIEIHMDRELVMAALSFWCPTVNTMILPLGPFGPTILDITAILGTSPSGLPIDTSLAGYKFDLDLKVVFEERAVEVLSQGDQRPPKEEVQKLYKNFFNYNTLITYFADSEKEGIRKGEHMAFLFYWYSKYIFCAKSNKCLAENIPVAEALASGHVLALSPTILANLTQCLAETTFGKIDPHQSGPLWVFQLWLQIYFPMLRPEVQSFNPSEAMGLELASRPIPAHSAEDIFKHFFGLEDLSDDEFQTCFCRTYPSSIILPQSAWDAAEDANLRESWGSFLITRDLPYGCEARRGSWEVYHANFLARQLGYLQGCPLPFLASRGLLSRDRFSGSSDKECEIVEKEFTERRAKFRIRPKALESRCTSTFAEWWDTYTKDLFQKPVEELVNKIFDGRPQKIAAPKPKETTQGGPTLKKADVIVAAAARKKTALSSRKTKKPAPALLGKRPPQVAETAGEPPRPTKRVKKLAKKGEREIHPISSHTTETTTPNAYPSTPVARTPTVVQQAPTGQVSGARPAPQVMVESAAAPLVKEMAAPAPAKPTVCPPVEEMATSEPIVAPVLERVTSATKTTPTKTPRQSAIILEV